MTGGNTEIRYLKGVGEARARSFERLGVRSLADLLAYFPRAYEDRSVTVPIAELRDGNTACVRAMVATEPSLSRVRRGMELVKLRAADDSGSIEIVFFNQGYVREKLHRGETYVFYGRVTDKMRRLSMSNPIFEREGAEGEQTGRIVPVYRLSAGLNQRVISQCVRQALDICANDVPDALPDVLRRRFKLCQAPYAYENIHFPADLNALNHARRRLVFEELLVLACALSLVRGGRGDSPGRALPKGDVERFYASLPFKPTSAQRRAVSEAARDMRTGRLMSRLVQGDVGSGKTLVAAACIWLAAQNGCQSAMMAPTEILAEQHYRSLTAFLAPFGLEVVKLTGSMPAKEKRKSREKLKNGEAALCVGTHALLSEEVEYNNLALVITDEQHRFGVAQRAALAAKGASPHILVMSATPIPRTLALIIYGDLDVSIIDELPPGRQSVDTFAVNSGYRERLNAFISRLVSEGRQAFVVCPMIEESEEVPTGLISATEHAETLKAALPGLNIACVHGKMKAKEKEAVMSAFVSGEIDVLVSTTVVEVGVDVPNAALMIVENAERFGLSQLHQLRGRVGRGQHKSYCVLVSDARGEDARERLRAMTRTTDGFAIAEEDLRLRGPGDFFGSRQHGLPELHIADLGADMNVLRMAQDAAQELMAGDPGLNAPEHRALRERAEALIATCDGRFN